MSRFKVFLISGRVGRARRGGAPYLGTGVRGSRQLPGRPLIVLRQPTPWRARAPETALRTVPGSAPFTGRPERRGLGLLLRPPRPVADPLHVAPRSKRQGATFRRGLDGRPWDESRIASPGRFLAVVPRA
jgi:hypothetical protein